MKEHIAEIQEMYYGLAEIAGKENNSEIVNFFHKIGFPWINDDETAWCSAMMNFLCMKYGYEYSGKLNARSWLDVGIHVKEPEFGDVVVFWRNDPRGWEGHVGFYIRSRKDRIYTLGGNQGDTFCIFPYPASRVLGYRRLEKFNIVNIN